MNEKIMNNEVNEETNYTPAEVNENSDGSGSGLIVAAVAGVATVAGGVAAYLYATRAKREAKKIEKLRKKGYTIIEPGENVVIDYVEVETEDVTESEAETEE